MDCKRVGIAVLGLEVPHAHIHLCPINDLYDIEFSKPKLKLSEEEFKNIAERISAEVSL
jgi:histidine triad (HIT) family protein